MGDFTTTTLIHRAFALLPAPARDSEAAESSDHSSITSIAVLFAANK